MTVMSEGLLLNLKYIKMGRKKGGFQAFFTQLPLVVVCPCGLMVICNLGPGSKVGEKGKKRGQALDYSP